MRRQAAIALARCLQLSQPAAAAPAAWTQLTQQAAAAAPAAWQPAAAGLHASAGRWAAAGGGITGWLTSKVGGMMGAGQIEDLDLDTFAQSVKQARRLGGLTGWVHGTGAVADGAAQGTMRMFESIIDAMTPEERKDLSLFGAEQRARVAAQVGVTTNQVDDCIARFLWTRQMTQKLAALKREGREAPTSVDEMERMLGTWRQYKSTNEGLDGGGGGAAVPLGHVGAHGQPCPLAGSPVGKNTKCTATNKSFKRCCGKTLKI